MSMKQTGFATLHREEVVRRVVRRIAAVLGLNDFGDRLDLSGVADCSKWEQLVLEAGCRQLGVHVSWVERLSEDEALDIVREGNAIVVRDEEGEYTVIERQVGRRIEVTTVNSSQQHGTIPRAAIVKLLGTPASGRVTLAQRELACDGLSVQGESTDRKHLSPLRRFTGFLKLEAHDIWTVVLFAFVSGILGLATPLAAESLVNVVSWGTYLQPLVVLSIILLGALGLSGVLTLLQTVVVEIIQRRQFVRIVGDLAHRFPRARRPYVDKEYPRELANRLFDIMTIQKATATLLLDGVSIVLTTCLGMLLLAVYHPFLLGFNIALLLAMISITWILGRRGISTSIEESVAKYEIIHWLQDVISFPGAFKINGGEGLAIERANSLAAHYLDARASQFRVVIRQVAFAIGLQVLASTALLGLGGWLVINRQLTLGQLVASELVVTVVVGAFAKAGKSLEKFYDLMAGIDKVGYLLDIPVDPRRGLLSVDDAPCSLEWTDLELQSGVNRRLISSGALPAGNSLALTGDDLVAKSLFVESVTGLIVPKSGAVTVADLDAAQAGVAGRGRLVTVANRIEVFHASIAENVELGRSGVGEDRIRDVLKGVGLWDIVQQLDGGTTTSLQTDGYPLSRDQVNRLMLARAIAARPRMIVIDGLLDTLPPSERIDVWTSMLGLCSPCTFVVATNDVALASACDATFTPGRKIASD